MRTIINVECIDQDMIVTNSPVIASGGVHENFIAFKFCSKWDGFTKTAVFYRNEKEKYHALVDDDNMCEVPQEVTNAEGTMYFGVFGVSGEVTRTSKVLKYKIKQGAITEDLKPSEPTPDIFQQILSEYNAQHLVVNELVADVSELKVGVETATNIAKGRNQAHVFTTTEAMKSWLSNADNIGKYKVGDNLYIVEVDVPDWWIAEVLDEVDTETGYYYKIAQLETQKVDLTEIESNIRTINNDIETLTTDISKVSEKADENAEKISTAIESFANIYEKYITTDASGTVIESTELATFLLRNIGDVPNNGSKTLDYINSAKQSGTFIVSKVSDTYFSGFYFTPYMYNHVYFTYDGTAWTWEKVTTNESLQWKHIGTYNEATSGINLSGYSEIKLVMLTTSNAVIADTTIPLSFINAVGKSMSCYQNNGSSTFKVDLTCTETNYFKANSTSFGDRICAIFAR